MFFVIFGCYCLLSSRLISINRFQFFLNSYVSVASRSLNCFISFKKFSYVLWFIFFSSKTDYSQVLKVINNYNQFLYFVTISNNRKDFSYFFEIFAFVFTLSGFKRGVYCFFKFNVKFDKDFRFYSLLL